MRWTALFLAILCGCGQLHTQAGQDASDMQRPPTMTPGVEQALIAKQQIQKQFEASKQAKPDGTSSLIIDQILRDPSILNDEKRIAGLLENKAADIKIQTMNWNPTKPLEANDPQIAKFRDYLVNSWSLVKIEQKPDFTIVIYFLKVTPKNEPKQPEPPTPDTKK